MRKGQHMLNFTRAILTESSASVEDRQQLVLNLVSLERGVDDKRVRILVRAVSANISRVDGPSAMGETHSMPCPV